MCGVVGVFHYRDASASPDMGLVRLMSDTLSHRGPDGEGFFSEDGVGLGHRRLAIVDLTETGRQPMLSVDGRLAMSYNGELYNHAELRPGLQSRGVHFRGTSDTETLIEAIAHDGPGVLARCAGIFSLACYFRKERRLLLARDHVGVKQLYFHDDGARIIFASEIKALLRDPSVSRSLDREAINEYLHFHTPLFDRTFFAGIRQLEPGQWLEVDSAGLKFHRYWEIPDRSPAAGDAAAFEAGLLERLPGVVGDQLMSDVPVGVFFSGGIDSSAVAAFGKRRLPSLRGFGIHFSHEGVVDERPFQESAAKALGLSLDLVTVGPSGFPEEFPRLLRQQDQPVIGTAIVPMFHVSRLAREQVTVCLGGQAADELFGGYARYAVCQSLGAALRGGASSSGGSGGRVGGNLFKQLRSARNLGRLARSLSRGADWRGRYFDVVAVVPEDTWHSVLDPSLADRGRAEGQFRDGTKGPASADPPNAAMRWDARTYLPGLFQQDDRMSMANSLESRVPFADPRLVEFAFSIPSSLKIKNGSSKWILRRVLRDVLPEDVLNRRKAGFDNPVEQWVRGPHRGFLGEILMSKAARERGLFNPRGVEAWLNTDARPYWFDVAFKLLSIEVWAREFLDSSPARSA